MLDFKPSRSLDGGRERGGGRRGEKILSIFIMGRTPLTSLNC